MRALLIPDVKREGNYIVVTYTRLHLLKSLYKMLKYKSIEKDMADCKPVQPQLKAGSTTLDMEQDAKGRWVKLLPRKTHIILIHKGKECDCGVI